MISTALYIGASVLGLVVLVYALYKARVIQKINLHVLTEWAN